MVMKYFLSLTLLTTAFTCTHTSDIETDYIVLKAQTEIIIDGVADEPVWKEAKWIELDQRWLGKPYSEEDFSGKFKLSWNEDHLYLLAEITDDSLYNRYEGTGQYWNNDILEIFVDEDASGGDHQFNFNAFAYHVDTNYNVFDIAPDSNAYYFNNHVDAKITRSGNIYIWETAIKIYDDGFVREEEYKSIKLTSGKIMGFALAYCDNDTSEFRENFIGSEVVEGKDKNRGWIDAGIFGTLKLTE